MKIYFSVPSDVREASLQEEYLKIIEVLESLGHQVLADHIKGKNSTIFFESDEDQDTYTSLVKTMMAAKNQSDLVVVEASLPSYSLGQEITYSLTLNKPVVVLYKKGTDKPRLLKALNTDSIHVVEYTINNLKQVLKEYIEYSKDMADTRFNFFISPQIGNYLDWIAQHSRVPRAVYLRDLIDKSIDEDVEYQGSTDKV